MISRLVILNDFSVLLSDPKWYPARQALRLDPSEYEELIIHNLLCIQKQKRPDDILTGGLCLYYSMAVDFCISSIIITTFVLCPFAFLTSVSLEITEKIFQDRLSLFLG